VACAPSAHSGPMLNQTDSFFRYGPRFGLVPAGTRFFRSVGVSELNEGGNPVHQFNWLNPDGTQTVVWSPDPGRALITGRIDQPGPASDLNSFKIPSLWGRLKNTAPLFPRQFRQNAGGPVVSLITRVSFLTLPDPRSTHAAGSSGHRRLPEAPELTNVCPGALPSAARGNLCFRLKQLYVNAGNQR